MVLVRGFEPCLVLYPQSAWRVIHEKVMALKAEPGLVIRYEYLWRHEDERGEGEHQRPPARVRE